MQPPYDSCLITACTQLRWKGQFGGYPNPSCQHFLWEETGVPGENPRLSEERYLTESFHRSVTQESAPRIEPTITVVNGTGSGDCATDVLYWGRRVYPGCRPLTLRFKVTLDVYIFRSFSSTYYHSSWSNTREYLTTNDKPISCLVQA